MELKLILIVVLVLLLIIGILIFFIPELKFPALNMISASKEGISSAGGGIGG